MKHMMLAVACAAMLTAPALGDWADDFQSYTLGSAICGQGDWSGWDGAVFTTAIVDSDPAGSGGQVLHEVPGNDIVHQYPGYTSGTWVYSAKQYLPSGQTGASWLILLSTYTVGGDPKSWNLDLVMDMTNNRVYDAEGGDAFYPLIYDQWVDIRIVIDLDQNRRAVYYNNVQIGFCPWYATGDPSHAKSIAAVDLWAADATIYYDDISLTPGTPFVLPSPPPDDITTYPGVAAKYLVNLGRDRGDTAFLWAGMTSGLYEYASAGGNQQLWWRINDGDVHPAMCMVTYGGASPDFVGYKFKLPATVHDIIWWNRTDFGDGGTFAATPDVQYLDAVNGTWQTIPSAEVVWDKPYNTLYGCGCRRYQVTLTNPPANVWGIRLYGLSQAGADDHGGATPTGFIGLSEMTLYGQVNAGVDLTNNLALGATGLMSSSQFGNPNALTDGDLWSYDTTAGADGSEILVYKDNWVGASWATPQTNVGAIGITLNGFADGGYFQGENLRVEYTTDGTTWTPVTGLNLGRYPKDQPTLMSYAVTWAKNYSNEGSTDSSHLFTFDTIPTGITGIRVIGPADGIGGDYDGFVGCYEVEVFARTTF